MGPCRLGRGVKNRCIHCHKCDADQWCRLIGQSVRAASIRTPVSARAFTRVGRMLRGPTAESTRRNTDRQRSCCSDNSGILAESRTSLPTVDAGKAISSPGSGFEPQAKAFTLMPFQGSCRKCQDRTGDKQILGLSLYPLS